MATCKDCLHYDVCVTVHYCGEDDANYCRTFADESLNINLPCKVGDTVYIVGRFYKKVKVREYTVQQIEVYRGFVVLRLRKTIEYAQGAIGRSVFFTRVEAEKALKERERDGNKN